MWNRFYFYLKNLHGPLHLSLYKLDYHLDNEMP